MSTRQALSQPLCCLGSVLVYRGSQRESKWEMGTNEWLQGSLKCHYVPSACPLQRCLVVCTESNYCIKAKFRQLHTMCFLCVVSQRENSSMGHFKKEKGGWGLLCGWMLKSMSHVGNARYRSISDCTDLYTKFIPLLSCLSPLSWQLKAKMPPK